MNHQSHILEKNVYKDSFLTVDDLSIFSDRFSSHINIFVPIAPFLYSLKTEN